MKLAKPAFAVSWLLIVVGVGYGFHRGKAAFGVDFLGGDTTIFSFEQKPGEAAVRAALTKAGIKDPRIQFQKDLTSRRETLRVDSATGTADKVKATLAEMTSAKFQSAAPGPHRRHRGQGNPEVGRHRRSCLPCLAY